MVPIIQLSDEVAASKRPPVEQAMTLKPVGTLAVAFTLSAGAMPPTVSWTLPSGVTMNVVRSAKPWSISMPRESLKPGRSTTLMS